MDDVIKEQLLNAIQRLRKPILFSYFAQLDLTTLSLMKSVEDNSLDSDQNIYMFDLQDELCIWQEQMSPNGRQKCCH